MRIATVLATCLTTTALALSAGVVPAHAASRTVTDPAGDVRTTQFSDDFDAEPQSQPADTSEGDVLTSKYTHSRRRITLSLTMAALPSSDVVHGWSFTLHGRNGQRRTLDIATGDDIKGIDAEMRRLSNGRRVCRGAIKRSIDTSANRVTTSFPRWCLGWPRAVRVSSSSIHLGGQYDENDDNLTIFYDDAHREGGNSFLFDQPTWSPWIRRG